MVNKRKPVGRFFFFLNKNENKDASFSNSVEFQQVAHVPPTKGHMKDPPHSSRSSGQT